MIKLFLESQIISINLVLLLFLAVRQYLRNGKSVQIPYVEYFCLAAFFVTPLLPFENKFLVNISVTSLGGYIATLIYPVLLAQLKEDTIKQKRRALKKVPILFIVIFYTMSNHVDLSYIYILAALMILTLNRRLAGAFFSWPFLLSGFFESSVIIEVLTALSFALGIYLFEDKDA